VGDRAFRSMYFDGEAIALSVQSAAFGSMRLIGKAIASQ